MEAQIQIYVARTIHTQTRLLATLDAVDALRETQARELSSERSAKERLSAKLDRYLDYIRVVEEERDEMREVTTILLRKGLSLHSVPEKLLVHESAASCCVHSRSVQ